MTTVLEAIDAFNRKDYKEVIAITNNLLKEDRTNGEAFNLMGSACLMMHNYEHAIGLFRRALTLLPNDPRVISNLAAALCDVDQIEESEVLAKQAVELVPGELFFMLNLARTYIKYNKFSQARDILLQILAIESSHREAHIALGYLLILTGEPRAGWKEVEEYQPVTLRDKYGVEIFPFPRWNGMCLPNKTLMVVCDQGYGDAIQFARYLKDTRERVSRLIVLGPPELSVLGKVSGVDEFFSSYDAIPAGDIGMYCNISSLPGIGLKGQDTPYITTYGVPIDGKRPHIGLVWRGRPVPQGRSIPFEKLVGVLRQYTFDQECTYVCLQKDVTDEEKAMLPEMTCPELTDFSVTAGIISTLNSVVGIDTAVTHLAGAIGVPVYLLLMAAQDWRWGTQTATGAVSPLYPRTRIFRQEVHGDWDSCLSKLKGWM